MQSLPLTRVNLTHAGNAIFMNDKNITNDVNLS